MAIANPYYEQAQLLHYMNRCGNARYALVKCYAWAIPNDEAIAAICELAPIVEIGAGTGYWAKLLADAGADVVAYDWWPPGRGNLYHGDAQTHFPIQRGGAPRAAKHPDRSLLLCWPPYDTPMAYQALRAYRGKHLIYIGEGQGGCNCTYAFFQLIAGDWRELRRIDIPQWDCIHDYCWIYGRK